MVKKFQFDDEVDDLEENNVNDTITDDKIVENNNEGVIEDVVMTKKTKKLKPWVIALLCIIIAGIIFVVYIFSLTNNDGPVYGSRCEGITAVNVDARNNTISTMKDKYDEIVDLTIEITCKQIKVDITYTDNMSTKKGIKIAEEVVKTLDKEVGLPKDEGKNYSQLFGYLKNEAQYDCQLILMSKNSDDYTIYGTKHHSSDKFSYTYSSVKDEESKNKAEKTLKDE